MNITLIGMPGAGKSFIGKILAERIKYKFIDIDAILEEKYQLSLPQILEKIGEQALLEEETIAVLECTAGPNNAVVSPGGSIVYSVKAMQHLQQDSVIIFLDATLATIEKRIGAVPRGIVGLKSQTLAELYRERVPLYRQYAHATIDANQEATSIIATIINATHAKPID